MTLGENPPRLRRVRRRAPPAINSDEGAVAIITGRISSPVGAEESGGNRDDGGSTSGSKYCWLVKNPLPLCTFPLRTLRLRLLRRVFAIFLIYTIYLIKQLYNFNKFFIFISFYLPNILIHYFYKFVQLIFHIYSFSIWIEANEYPFTTMYHE